MAVGEASADYAAPTAASPEPYRPEGDAGEREMRDLEDLLSKLNPMAEEFVPPSLAAPPAHAAPYGHYPNLGGGFASVASPGHRGVVGFPTADGLGGRGRKKGGGGYGGHGHGGKRRMNSRTSMAQHDEVIRRMVYVSDIDHQDAFILWDTYGYPIDLTEVMAIDYGLTVDLEGFSSSMEEARQKARNARNKAGGNSIVMDANATSQLRNQGLASTDDSPKFQHKEHESVVKAIYTGSEYIATASDDEDVGLVLESTSFYAEQGGQIYDTGSIEWSFGSFTVNNVQVFAGYVLHIGSFTKGSLSVGDKVTCKVDYIRRALIAPNHTCTHMLNFALREVLGDHVDQKGSIVLPEKLRFDFSHGKPVQPEDLRKIESIVNQQIKEKLEVFAREIKLADAKRINGLRAVFGEIYPDPVRVVSVGRRVEDLLANPESKEWLAISTELCGGTHIKNTGDAKAFGAASLLLCSSLI